MSTRFMRPTKRQALYSAKAKRALVAKRVVGSSTAKPSDVRHYTKIRFLEPHLVKVLPYGCAGVPHSSCGNIAAVCSSGV